MYKLALQCHFTGTKERDVCMYGRGLELMVYYNYSLIERRKEHLQERGTCHKGGVGKAGSKDCLESYVGRQVVWVIHGGM